MKKLFLVVSANFFIASIFSQSNKWDLNGNSSNTNDFIGTTNSQALVFKTDNAVRLKISPTGNLIVKDLESSGIGLVRAAENGRLGKVDLPNDPSYFLDGTGHFSPLLNYTYWSLSNNCITTDASKNIGIGVPNPTSKLDVGGDAKIRGVLHVKDSIHVGDSSVWIGTSVTGASFLYSDPLTPVPPSYFGGALQINGNINSPNTFINQGHGTLYIGTPSNSLVYGGQINPIYKAVVKQGLIITGKDGVVAFRGGQHTPGLPPSSISPNISGDIAIGFTDLPGGDLGCTNPIKGLNIYRPTPHDAGPSSYNFFISTLPASAGNIGVGTAYPKFKFTVEGSIGARKVVVESAGWCDFVFEDDYELMSFESLQTYIKENKHLPNIPSEKEIIKNGIDVTKVFQSHTQSIEETVLYILELKNLNDELKTEMKNLKQEVDAIKQELIELKAK